VADAEKATSTEAVVPDATDIPDKLYFRIGEVAGLVGVDAHVLRYWESEFSLKPHRSSSGQRLYRKPDLAMFMRIRLLLHDEGYTIAGARRVLSEGDATRKPADLVQVRRVLKKVEALRAALANFRAEIFPSPDV
jgi:DNA-binding transcriptional MerR regulator